MKKRLKIVPVMLALILVSLFLPAQRVTIETIGRLSLDTSVTLSIGQQVAYASPGWLSGWAKRVKLTIDSGDIDAALSDFPIMVYISASSGYNSDDVSCVFDELTSDDNRKKIAVTTSDGTTECKVEIEKWDDANEKAWLWVKVPNISSSVDTDLYLYYDKTQDDNTTYVGDSGSRTEVWDGNFKAVYHLGEASGGIDAIKDSTQNANHCTDSGSPTFGADGKTGKAIQFDGSDDLLDSKNNIGVSGDDSRLIEVWMKPADASPTDSQSVVEWGACSTGNINSICYDRSQSPEAIGIHGWAADLTGASDTITRAAWNYVAYTYDGTTVRAYVNGAEQNYADKTRNTTDSVVRIAAPVACNGYFVEFEGVIDEVRISNSLRSVAWLTASYESERDHLLDWGSEETSGDTTPPTVTVVVTPDPAKAGTVTFTLTFNEDMNQSVAPTVTFGLTSPYNQNAVSGSYSDATHWSGTGTDGGEVKGGYYFFTCKEIGHGK